MKRALTALAATQLAALAVVPAGHAAVTIGPDRVTVTASGAGVSATRAPFRLSFTDGAGRTVLSQVPNGRAAPFPVPPTPQPQPLGGDTLDGPTLYEPLTFLVGEQRSLLFPGTQWAGNQLTGTETGVQYSARDVISAERDGEGARLEVATSDPSGRRLVVALRPAGDAVRVSVRATPDDGVASMSDSFATFAGEPFRGFGGRHNALDQRGQDFYNWVEQQNVGAGPLQPAVDPQPGSGGQGYLFPNGPTAAYYVQSQFVSRNYGFMLERNELSGWRMASDRPDAWQVTTVGRGIDYLVAPGGPRASIGTLTGVGGRQRVPPDWGVGPMLDRLTRFPADGAEAYERSVRDDLASIDRYDLPLTAYRVEAWHYLSDASLRDVIRRLGRRDIRALAYFRPFVGRDEIGTDDPADFDYAVERGLVAKTETGQPYLFVNNFGREAALIDFTNPEAVAWWRERVRGALELGFDGFMQDFGEQVQNDMRFANGETGATMHNRYPVLFHATTRKIVAEWERQTGRRTWFFTRSGYSGSPGAPAYENANFPGDETTDWSRSSGLASQAPDMLNRGVGGAFGFGSDIGGYFDFNTPPTTKELFIRWAEWSALSPVMRLHGSVREGTHTPWTYDQATVDVYDRLSRLHLAARPLILRLWREAERTGLPVARPLWLHHPDDPVAARQDQQWLLGPDVLVAPVVREGARAREVYFPRGCWRSPETGDLRRGPATARVSVPLERLAYWFRCGTSPFKVASARADDGRRAAPRGGGGRSGARERAGAAAATQAGSLPFTGFDLSGPLLAGLALLLCGATGRRAARAGRS